MAPTTIWLKVPAGASRIAFTTPGDDSWGHGSEAVALAATLNPDLVLMDLQLGQGCTGADSTRQIRAEGAEPYVLVLTYYDSGDDILSPVEAGASGYLLKDAPPDELLTAVRAAAGESALASAVAGHLMARMRAPQVRLSAREIEVLRLVAEGAPSIDVAAQLHISDATVKSHLVHVFSKLGVNSRTVAVSEARTLGVLR